MRQRRQVVRPRLQFALAIQASSASPRPALLTASGIEALRSTSVAVPYTAFEGS